MLQEVSENVKVVVSHSDPRVCVCQCECVSPTPGTSAMDIWLHGRVAVGVHSAWHSAFIAHCTGPRGLDLPTPYLLVREEIVSLEHLVPKTLMEIENVAIL